MNSMVTPHQYPPMLINFSSRKDIEFFSQVYLKYSSFIKYRLNKSLKHLTYEPKRNSAHDHQFYKYSTAIPQCCFFFKEEIVV